MRNSSKVEYYGVYFTVYFYSCLFHLFKNALTILSFLSISLIISASNPLLINNSFTSLPYFSLISTNTNVARIFARFCCNRLVKNQRIIVGNKQRDVGFMFQHIRTHHRSLRRSNIRWVAHNNINFINRELLGKHVVHKKNQHTY